MHISFPISGYIMLPSEHTQCIIIVESLLQENLITVYSLELSIHVINYVPGCILRWSTMCFSFFSFFFYSSSMTKGTPDIFTGVLCKGSQRVLEIARLVCHLCLGFTQKLGDSAQRLSPYKLLAQYSLQCQESTGPLSLIYHPTNTCQRDVSLVKLQTRPRISFLVTNSNGHLTHSTTLGWTIPRTEEPGGLQSRGRKESDTSERLSTHQISYLGDSGCARVFTNHG